MIGYGYNSSLDVGACGGAADRCDWGDSVDDRSDGEINYANTISYTISAKKYEPSYTGVASYYGGAFAGRTTACGQVFDPDLFTAASMRHQCGTQLRACRLDGDRCVDIVVNDTGAFEELGRVIDLSEGAFEKLAPASRGLIRVRVEEKQ